MMREWISKDQNEHHRYAYGSGEESLGEYVGPNDLELPDDEYLMKSRRKKSQRKGQSNRGHEMAVYQDF